MTLHPAQDESVANYCLTRLLMRGLKTRIFGERPEHSVSSDGSSDKGRLFLLTAQVRKNPTCHQCCNTGGGGAVCQRLN